MLADGLPYHSFHCDGLQNRTWELCKENRHYCTYIYITCDNYWWTISILTKNSVSWQTINHSKFHRRSSSHNTQKKYKEHPICVPVNCFPHLHIKRLKLLMLHHSTPIFLSYNSSIVRQSCGNANAWYGIHQVKFHLWHMTKISDIALSTDWCMKVPYGIIGI